MPKTDNRTNVLGRRRRKPQTPATVRRNERERNRVRHVNACFSRLRQFVGAIGPNGTRRHAASSGSNASKRLSKVDTLRAAIVYIKQLQETLHQGEDAERFQPQNYPQVTIVDLVEPAVKRSCIQSSSSDEDCCSSSEGSKTRGALSSFALSPSCSSNGSSTAFHQKPQPRAVITSLQSVPNCHPYSTSPYLSSPKLVQQYVHSSYSPANNYCHKTTFSPSTASSPACAVSPPVYHGVPTQANYYYYHQQQQIISQNSSYYWQQPAVNYCR